MTEKLPEAPVLAELRRHCSYRTIAGMYDASPQAVWTKLNNHGLLNRVYTKAGEKEFWLKASTAVALIRAGCRNEDHIRQAIGYKSRSNTHYFIKRLIKEGLVTKGPDKKGTLCLTEKGQAFGPLVVIARARADGGLERMRS